MTAQPTITVVTVNFRNAAGLRRTLDSVLAQDYPHLELVVKDGNSGGADAALLEDMRPRIDILDTSVDKGIYDAMNIAVGLSHDDWVIFMNSGDVFHDATTLSQIMAATTPETADIIQGQARIVSDDTGDIRITPVENAHVLPYRMNGSHQATLVRRQWLVRFPFTVAADRISSDYGFLLNCFANKARFVTTDVIIADCEAGGVSQIQRKKSLRDRILCLRETGLLTWPLRVYYTKLLVRAYLRSALSRGRLK